MTAREELPPNRPTKLGRYELITRIGQGGMAEVQLAIQRGPAGFEKLVVVKLVHENLATQKTFVDMLLDEARVAALVKHPNVVDIYDLGEVEGRYFIAMEYLEGEPLLSLLRAGREGKRLDVMSTARLVADTAEGLDAAHELRSIAGEALELVHHDVSLGNIVVLYTGQVKLVDFGVAKATQSTATRNKVQGKFSYMAPEKLRGDAGDRRSDIFSLGCVLWESLTLKRLFRGGNDTETMKQVLESVIVPPSQINPDVPDELDPIVMRALEREAEHRYGTAAELAADLEDVLRKHAYPRRNDAIAKYMQETFKDHISARKKLLQEVSSKGTASTEILDLAFSEPLIASGSTPGINDFSVKFKRSSMEMPAIRPPTEGSDELVIGPGRRAARRDSTPVPSLPVRSAPLGGSLEHAGSQPLAETDLARGLSGQVPVVSLPEDLEPTEAPPAPAPKSKRREAVLPPAPESANRSRRPLLIVLAVLVVAAGAFAAMRLFGGHDDEGDDNAPVHARKPAGVLPPKPVAPDAAVGVGAPDAEVAATVTPDAEVAAAVTPDAAVVTPDAAAAGVDAAMAVAPPDAHVSDSDEVPTAESLYRIGEGQSARGEFGKALASLKHAQQVDPAFAPTWRALGKLHYKMGDHPAARAAFQKYLQLAPNAADAPQIRQLLETL